MHDALSTLLECLEPAPELGDWQIENELRNMASDGVPVGIPLTPQRVRVKAGMGDRFWDALGDLYESKETSRA